jgi:hypothetical protein
MTSHLLRNMDFKKLRQQIETLLAGTMQSEQVCTHAKGAKDAKRMEIFSADKSVTERCPIWDANFPGFYLAFAALATFA